MLRVSPFRSLECKATLQTWLFFISLETEQSPNPDSTHSAPEQPTLDRLSRIGFRARALTSGLMAASVSRARRSLATDTFAPDHLSPLFSPLLSFPLCFPTSPPFRCHLDTCSFSLASSVQEKSKLIKDIYLSRHEKDDGNWEDNRMSGKGSYVSASGVVYTGTFFNDKFKDSGNCYRNVTELE